VEHVYVTLHVYLVHFFVQVEQPSHTIGKRKSEVGLIMLLKRIFDAFLDALETPSRPFVQKGSARIARHRQQRRHGLDQAQLVPKASLAMPTVVDIAAVG